MASKDQVRVLIVDDMATSRGLLYDCFDTIGIRNVKAARNGDDALNMLKKELVHLVVSDYNMPGKNGLQLLKAIRLNKRTKGVGFILVTGSADQTLIDQGRKLGMNNYLQKPYKPEDLRRCVWRVLGPLG